MKFQLNLYAILLAFPFVHGLLYAILFWLRGWRQERKSDVIFGFLLLSSCLYLLDWLFGFMGIHILWTELAFFPWDMSLLIGPFCYFYLKTQTNTDFAFIRADIWHFLPYIIQVVYHLIIFVQGHQFVSNWQDKVHQPFHIQDLEFYGTLISNFTYFFLSIKLYQKYRYWTPTQFSDIDAVSFRWYRNFLVAIAVAFISSWVVNLLEAFGVNFSYWDIWWEKILVGIIIYYVSIAAYTQPQPKKISFIAEQKAPENAKFTEIEVQDLELWKTKIKQLFEQEKIYLNPELTLSDLSNRLKTYNSLLSGVINNGFGKNFNDFVNEFRVQEFQERVHLPENRNITLLGVAFDCGFNSKATFNRVFKKMTNQSPKEFLEKKV